MSYHLGLYDQVKHTGPADPTSQALGADSFEAYIGALYKDGQNRGQPYLVRDWLEKLWAPAVFPSLGVESKLSMDHVEAKVVKVTERDDRLIGETRQPNVKGHKMEGTPSGAKDAPDSQTFMQQMATAIQLLKTKKEKGPAKKADDRSTGVVGETTTGVPEKTTRTKPTVLSQAPSPKPKEKVKATIQGSIKLQGDQPKNAKIVKAKRVDTPPAPAAPAVKSKKKKTKQPVLA